MENIIEQTNQANARLAELIKDGVWGEIRNDEEIHLMADGRLLVKCGDKRLSLLDLARAYDAPQRVIKVLEGLGFEGTEVVKRHITAGEKSACRA